MRSLKKKSLIRDAMEMKKFKGKSLIAVFAMLLLLLSLPAASAQPDNNAKGARINTTADTEVAAGITPDSPLYFLSTALARLGLALTFDKAAKAEKGLSIALKRLLEVQAMAEAGKPEKAEKAEREYDKALDAATKAAEGIESNGDFAAARKALERISYLQNQTESHYEKVTEVKDGILQRQGLRMSPEKIAKLQQVFSKIEYKARQLEIKLDSKKDKVKAKQKALANLTSEEVNALEKEIDEKTGLAKGRYERAEKEIGRAKAAIELAKERTRATKAKGINVAEIEDLLDEADRQAARLRASQAINNKSAQYHAEQLADFGNEVSALATLLGKAKKEGEFREVFNKMKETIRERHIESLEDVSGEASERSERAEEAINEAIERDENRTAEDDEEEEVGEVNSEREKDQGKSLARITGQSVRSAQIPLEIVK